MTVRAGSYGRSRQRAASRSASPGTPATTSIPSGARMTARSSSRAEGATAAGRTITANAYYDLVRIAAAPPAGGDTGDVVATVGRPPEAGLSGEARRQLLRPSFGP